MTLSIQRNSPFQKRESFSSLSLTVPQHPIFILKLLYTSRERINFQFFSVFHMNHMIEYQYS